MVFRTSGKSTKDSPWHMAARAAALRDSELMERLERRNALDLQLFAFATEVFEHRMRVQEDPCRSPPSASSPALPASPPLRSQAPPRPPPSLPLDRPTQGSSIVFAAFAAGAVIATT